ncbi:MAG TPA: hypothetical protein VMU48_13925 [Terracidiphilus sp.]|nr:hypothetical protein [Terracidiphilus sp.]
MSKLSLRSKISSGAQSGAIVCLAIGLVAGSASMQAAPAGQSQQQSAEVAGMSGGSMMHKGHHMSDHMFMSTMRPLKPGDQQKADAIVAAAKEAMAPYQDYRKALADGYRIFLPNIPQPLYHFTNYENGREAAFQFDPLKPTSLLYIKTTDGGYKLIGAMYTDRVNASQDELNDRIPLSIAHWHQHVNFCKAPPGQLAAYFGPNAKFGLLGSIHTKDACDAAGGTFIPHVFGWMVHVYPYESDPKKVWSTDDDAAGHDNMDGSPMPGMKMN